MQPQGSTFHLDLSRAMSEVSTSSIGPRGGGDSPHSSVEEVERESVDGERQGQCTVETIQLDVPRPLSEVSDDRPLFGRRSRILSGRLGSVNFSGGGHWVPLFNYQSADGTTWTTVLLEGPYASLAGAGIQAAQAAKKVVGSAAQGLSRRPMTQVVAVSACGGAITSGAAGAVAGSAVGGTAGILAGLVAAPFTLGLSIPVGAAVGSCTGLCIGATGGGAAGATGGGLLGYVGYQCCILLRTPGTS